MDVQLRAIGAEVLGLLLALRHQRQQAGQQCAMDGFVLARLRVRLERELALHHLHHLAMHVMPLGEPQVGGRFVAAPGAQPWRRDRCSRCSAQARHSFSSGQEVGLLVAQQRVFLVGLGLLVRRAVARIRHRQRRGDDGHFLETAFIHTSQQDAAQPRSSGSLARRRPSSVSWPSSDSALISRSVRWPSRT